MALKQNNQRKIAKFFYKNPAKYLKYMQIFIKLILISRNPHDNL